MQSKLESLGILLISLGIILMTFNPINSNWSVDFVPQTSVLVVNMPKFMYLTFGWLGFVIGLCLILTEVRTAWAKRALKIVRNRNVMGVIWIIFLGNYVLNCAKWVVALNPSVQNPNVPSWAVTFITFVLLVILGLLIVAGIKRYLNKSVVDRQATLTSLRATALVFGLFAFAVVVFQGDRGVTSAIKYLSVSIVLLSSTLMIKEKKEQKKAVSNLPDIKQ